MVSLKNQIKSLLENSKSSEKKTELIPGQESILALMLSEARFRIWYKTPR